MKSSESKTSFYENIVCIVFGMMLTYPFVGQSFKEKIGPEAVVETIERIISFVLYTFS